MGTPLRSQLAGRVVRRLDRHLDVMRMALCQPSRGDPDETTVGLQLLDRVGAAVAHGRSEAADELMRNSGEWTAERHLTLDAFRHQLLVGQDVVLEVAVAGI